VGAKEKVDFDGESVFVLALVDLRVAAAAADRKQDRARIKRLRKTR
jgi:hypothetical protein